MKQEEGQSQLCARVSHSSQGIQLLRNLALLPGDVNLIYVPLQPLFLQGEELIHLDGKCCPECISRNGYCVYEGNGKFVSIRLITKDDLKLIQN